MIVNIPDSLRDEAAEAGYEALEAAVHDAQQMMSTYGDLDLAYKAVTNQGLSQDFAAWLVPLVLHTQDHIVLNVPRIPLAVTEELEVKQQFQNERDTYVNNAGDVVDLILDTTNDLSNF